MHLFLALIEKADAAERLIARFAQFGLGEPWVVRARSAAAVLSSEVPVFGGLKGLVLGADEDKLIAVSIVAVTDPVEVNRLVTRVQLEMDADDPPMGKLYAVPLLTAGAASGR